MIRQRDEDGDVSQEWEFDSHALFEDATSPSIAYVAFYSDVEHEVYPVGPPRQDHEVQPLLREGWAVCFPGRHCTEHSSRICFCLPARRPDILALRWMSHL